MRIVALLAADYARIDNPDGKLDILGAFRKIFADQFPFTPRRICFVLVLEVDAEESTRTREVEARLDGPDGEALTAIEATLPSLAESKEAGQFSVICEMETPSFASPGEYAFRVRFDGGEFEASTVFEVVQRAP